MGYAEANRPGLPHQYRGCSPQQYAQAEEPEWRALLQSGELWLTMAVFLFPSRICFSGHTQHFSSVCTTPMFWLKEEVPSNRPRHALKQLFGQFLLESGLAPVCVFKLQEQVASSCARKSCTRSGRL